MDIGITKDVQNRLLKRREIQFSLIYPDRTPSEESVKEEICKKLNLDPASTVIVEIEQLYGGKRSTCIVHSYDSIEAMKIEAGHLLERHKKKAQPAKEPANAEGPKHEGKGKREEKKEEGTGAKAEAGEKEEK